jgi:hypothetical protein
MHNSSILIFMIIIILSFLIHVIILVIHIIIIYILSVHEASDMDTGLLGAIIVYKQGTTDSNRRPRHINQEFYLFFKNFDETASLYYASNLAKWHVNIATDPLSSSQAAIQRQLTGDVIPSSQKSSINGCFIAHFFIAFALHVADA